MTDDSYLGGSFSFSLCSVQFLLEVNLWTLEISVQTFISQPQFEPIEKF